MEVVLSLLQRRLDLAFNASGHHCYPLDDLCEQETHELLMVDPVSPEDFQQVTEEEVVERVLMHLVLIEQDEFP